MLAICWTRSTGYARMRAVDCHRSALIGAEKSGIPAALLVHFPIHALADGVTPFGLGLKPARSLLGRFRDRALLAVMRHMFRFGLAPVNAARQELGLAPVRDVFDQLHVLSRSLVLTSREYDFVPTGLPAHVRYVGPQLDDPAWPGPWMPPWSTDSRLPLVVASLVRPTSGGKTFGAIVRRRHAAGPRIRDARRACSTGVTEAPHGVTVVPSRGVAAASPWCATTVTDDENAVAWRTGCGDAVRSRSEGQWCPGRGSRYSVSLARHRHTSRSHPPLARGAASGAHSG